MFVDKLGKIIYLYIKFDLESGNTFLIFSYMYIFPLFVKFNVFHCLKIITSFHEEKLFGRKNFLYTFLNEIKYIILP